MYLPPPILTDSPVNPGQWHHLDRHGTVLWEEPVAGRPLERSFRLTVGALSHLIRCGTVACWEFRGHCQRRTGKDSGWRVTWRGKGGSGYSPLLWLGTTSLVTGNFREFYPQLPLDGIGASRALPHPVYPSSTWYIVPRSSPSRKAIACSWGCSHLPT